MYRSLQLALNRHFFLFEWKFKTGNSLTYTLYMISQYVIGYIAIYSYSSYYMKINNQPLTIDTITNAF